MITDEGLYCFIVNSPKRRDLERDGRYALHSYPPEENDDEAYLAGHAVRVRDPLVVAQLSGSLRASPDVDWHLYELQIETATLRRHGPVGALPLSASPLVLPKARTWRSELSRPLAAAS